MKIKEKLKLFKFIYDNFNEICNSININDLSQAKKYKEFYIRETSNMSNLFKTNLYNYDLKLEIINDKIKVINSLKMNQSSYAYNKYGSFVKVKKKKDKENEIAALLMTAMTFTNPLYEITGIDMDKNNDMILSLNTPLEYNIFSSILKEIYSSDLTFENTIEKSYALDRLIFSLKFESVDNAYTCIELFYNTLNEKIIEYINSIIGKTEQPLKDSMIEYLNKFIKTISAFEYIYKLEDANQTILDIYNSQYKFAFEILNIFERVDK